MTLGWALLKLTALIAFALIAGQRIIPWFLGYVARTGSRDLFTLAVLVLALGIAVGSAKFFGASMALGAFLAGMVVGQSEFSARTASDALPMRDAFAVLFFVSVGMLFRSLGRGRRLAAHARDARNRDHWQAASGVCRRDAVPAAAAFCAVDFGRARPDWRVFVYSGCLGIRASRSCPPEATNALVVASVASITLNPLLYRGIEPVVRWLESKGISSRGEANPLEDAENR